MPILADTTRLTTPRSPGLNGILTALPAADYVRLLPNLELVPLPLGCSIYESGGELDYVYFPTNSIVSLLYVMEDGASAEIAVVGNDGVVGIPLFMGGESTPSRAVVQSAGTAIGSRQRAEKGIRSRRGAAASAAALHAGADRADGADRGVQPAPFAGAATVPLAALEPGPAALERADHDPGADRQHAGSAPRGRHRAAGHLQAAGLIHYRRGHITV